jgi:acetyl-CoA/propionyl-CoA carboxylase biotin carboxyl carrier protein
VREQFRIAQGEEPGYTADPAPRGHAFEFRINGEDPGRGFLPAPGTITGYHEPAGPGVRVGSPRRGRVGTGRAFDSLLAKLIVYGRSREEALPRARPALAEFRVDGIATVRQHRRRDLPDPR